MKDFFSQFRDNLASRPEPEFDAQDWQKLERRLDRSPEKRRLALPIFGWLWLPLGLLLLGSNAAFWLEIRHAHQTIERLESRRDTVFLTKIVRQTDTVFLTRVLRQTIVEHLPTVFRANENQVLDKPIPTAQPAVFEEKNAPDWTSLQPAEKSLVVENQKVATSFSNDSTIVGELSKENFLEKKDTVLEKTLAPKIAETHPENLPSADSLAQKPDPEKIQKGKKSPDGHLLALRPKSFALLATGGWAMPPLAGRHFKPGWSAGLVGEVGFSKNLRLWADVNFQQNRLETQQMDAALGVPPIAPPDDNLKFVLATAPEKFWQFSVGMAHVFRPLGGWRPMLGAGWGIRRAQAYDLTYDFENEALGVSWKFEQEVQPAEKQVQFALLRGGVEREFSGHWRLQIGGGLRGDFADGVFRSPRFSGLQLGFGRRF